MKKIVIATASILALIVSGLFIILLNAGNLIRWYLKPEYQFNTARTPSAPDYSKESNWAALPAGKNDAQLAPPGLVPTDPAKAPADVFYIHPTGYFGSETWNSTADPGSSAYKKVKFMLASQASVFNGCCVVYAPHYREATLYSFFDRGNDGMQALDLAYSDVARAFDYYIRNFNQKRPFIIASHSQGSVHALRLLEEKIDKTGLHHQLVAAYVIGASIPVEKFTRSFTRIRPCTGPRDTGCLISWNTCAQGSASRKMLFVRYRTGWEKISDKDIICTNPFTWKNDGMEAGDRPDSGAVLFKPGGLWKLFLFGGADGRTISYLEAPARLKLSAQCIDGFLYVPKVKGIADLLGRGNYHIYDYSLFYMDIRKNVCERVSAFLRAR